MLRTLKLSLLFSVCSREGGREKGKNSISALELSALLSFF